MLTKYLFKIGTIETYVYEEFTHDLADANDGSLTLETIKSAINVLAKYGDKYWSSIDSLAFLEYLMERECVTVTTVIEKSEGL